MGRGRRDYGSYIVSPQSNGRSIRIVPKYKSAKNTNINFGLGNAVININIDHPPQEVTKVVTGETSARGLIPTSPYLIGEWYAYPTGFDEKTKSLIGFNGQQLHFSYKEATGFSSRKAKSVEIKKNGVGTLAVGRTSRINW